MRRLAIAICSAPFLLIASVVAQDTEAPMLTSIGVSPLTVDVSTGASSVTVTVEVTDDDSGFSFGNVQLYAPGDTFIAGYVIDGGDRTLGDEFDGTYEVTVPVSQYSPPGTWEARILLFDNVDNDRRYGGSNEAFPIPGDEEFTVQNSGTVDSEAPQATSIGVTPASIDTGITSQQLVVTITVTDNLSGMNYGFIRFEDPAGSIDYSLDEYFDSYQLVSGTALSGTYEVTCTIPAGSDPGTWILHWSLRDQTGNVGSGTGLSGGEFTVTSSGGAQGDLGDAIDATHLVWSTSGDADWFLQGATTYDGVDAAQSGDIGDDETSEMSVTVTGPGTLDFFWKVDCEAVFDELSVDGPAEFYDAITGDTDWTPVSIPIPPGSHDVTWTYSKDLSDIGGADAGWVDRVTFRRSDTDVDDPVLQRISISPPNVDLLGGDREVTITVEISDDFNGASTGTLTLWDLSGYDFDSLSFDASDRISGDAFFGTYQVSTTLYAADFDPEEGYLQTGTIRVEAEITEDLSGNSRFYGPGSDPFPIPGANLFTVTNDGSGGGGDLPVLVSIDSITPDPLLLAGAPGSVAATFRISDAYHGFDYGYVYLYNPSGGYVGSQFFDFNQLDSGDEYAGTYSVLLSLPAVAPPGTWTLGFDLYNASGYDSSYPFVQPFPNPGDEEFVVQNIGIADTTSPVLTAFSLTPAAVDTTSAMQTVNFSLTFTDDLAGLGGVSVSVYNPSGSYVGSLSTYFPGSGSLGDTFNGTIDLPQGSVEGAWRCAVSLRDEVGNTAFHSSTSGLAFPVVGSDTFTVGALGGTTYENFVAANSLAGLDALPGSNPDGDWLINALELILGTNPNTVDAPDPGLLSMERVGNQLRIRFTVAPSLSVTPNGVYLEVSDGGAPVMVTGQSNGMLAGPWSTQAPALVSGSSYEVTLPITSPGAGFLRLFFQVP